MFGKKEKPEKKEGFIKRLRARINKGDSWLTYDLANLAPGGKIDEDTLEELEMLGELGIHFGQGWLFGHATPLRARED